MSDEKPQGGDELELRDDDASEFDESKSAPADRDSLRHRAERHGVRIL